LTVIGEKSGRTLPARRNPQGFLLRQLPPGNCLDTRVIGYCAVFKVRAEARPFANARGLGSTSAGVGAGLSKLNSMRAIGWRRLHWEKFARNTSVFPPLCANFSRRFARQGNTAGSVDIARADRSRRSLPKKGSLERR